MAGNPLQAREPSGAPGGIGGQYKKDPNAGSDLVDAPAVTDLLDTDSPVDVDGKTIEFDGCYTVDDFTPDHSEYCESPLVSYNPETQTYDIDNPSEWTPLSGRGYHPGWIFESNENADNKQIQSWVREAGYRTFSLQPVYKADDISEDGDGEPMGWAIMMTNPVEDEDTEWDPLTDPVDITPEACELVEQWGDSYTNVWHNDDELSVSYKILEDNGMDPDEHPEMLRQVRSIIAPAISQLDGDMPGGSQQFARNAIMNAWG